MDAFWPKHSLDRASGVNCCTRIGIEVRAVSEQDKDAPPEDGGPAEKPGEILNGFNMIVRDFDRAIGYARLNGLQTFLLQRAREASWTEATLEGIGNNELPPAKPFRLNVSRLARMLGCSRRALQVAHGELFDIGIFVPVARGLARIGKDYRRWRDPSTNTRLLTDEAIRESADAKRLKRRKGCAENSAGCAENSAAQVRSKQRTKCAENSAPPALKTAHLPIDTSAPGIRDLRETGDHNPSDCARAAAAGSPAPSGELNPGPGIFSPEAEALARWAEPLGGNWSHWARCKCNSYPAWWMKALLQRKVEGVKPPPREAMLNAILQGWKVAGCEYPDPDAPTPPASANGHPAAPADRAAEKAARQSEDLRAAAADLMEGR
jgi:hypothetical protein